MLRKAEQKYCTPEKDRRVVGGGGRGWEGIGTGIERGSIGYVQCSFLFKRSISIRR